MHARVSFCAGTFGRVLECWDRKRKDYVAIKIVRNIDKYRHAAMIEVRAMPAVRLCADRMQRAASVLLTAYMHSKLHMTRLCPCLSGAGLLPQLEVLNTLERNDPDGQK